MRMYQTPLYRTILAVDIEGSTTRSNMAKAQARRIMYDLLEEALQAAGIESSHHDPLVDRGDGVLVLIHPVEHIPKTALLNTVVPTLADLLDMLPTEHSFRLRAAVHAGEVHYDARGCFGEALDITCRLLDAREVKQTLRMSSSPLVLVVSDTIYQSVVRHAYHGIDDHKFEPAVHLRMANGDHRGWVHVPAVDNSSTLDTAYGRGAGTATMVDIRQKTSGITFDREVDMLLRCAGEALDARATVRSMSPEDVVERILKKE